MNANLADRRQAMRERIRRRREQRDSARLSEQQRERVSLNEDTTAAAPPKPRIQRVKTDLDNPVDIQASDSMVLIGQNNAYLYGDGKVVYGDIKLDAENIEMNLDSSTVYAVGTTDSTGEVIGSPVFNDKGTEYERSEEHTSELQSRI